MELLRAIKLVRSVGGEPLFPPLDLRIHSGTRLGLVGANAAGKSTLLATLAGVTAPDEGTLRRAPGLRVGYLPQASEAYPPGADVWEVASGGLAAVRDAEASMRHWERRMAGAPQTDADDPDGGTSDGGTSDGRSSARPERQRQGATSQAATNKAATSQAPQRQVATSQAAEHRVPERQAAEDAYAEAVASFERLGGYAAEARLARSLANLGLPEERFGQPAEQLSGGERRRLALATAMAGEPELLLLDEPANHLDMAMRRWLAARLATWNGALVVVSHDRALLDGATNATLFLAGSGWELRRGNYARAAAARGQDLASSRKQERERQREAMRLQAMAQELASFGNRGAQRRKRAARRAAERAPQGSTTSATPGRTSGRPAGPPTGPTARAAGPMDVTLRSRSSRRSLHGSGPVDQRAERSGNLGASKENGAGGVGSLRLRTRELPGLSSGLHLEARHLLRRGVLDVPSVRLHAGERVALLGPNGSGKTTLLRMLAGDLPSEDPRAAVFTPPRLRLALVTQLERGMEDGVAALEQVERLVTRERAKALLAQVGIGPSAWDRAPEGLSGGQRARAGIALLMAREADILLLDEPTNDLDLQAVEALEEALLASDAAIIVATHDQRLAEALGGTVWGIADGRLDHYGDVAGYLLGRPSRSPRPPGPSGAPAGAPSVDTDRPAAAALDAAELDAVALDVAALDVAALDVVEALEEERKVIDDLLLDPSRLSDRDRARAGARLAELDDALAEAHDRRFPPPSPRFRVRERGHVVLADRIDDGLVALLSGTGGMQAVSGNAASAGEVGAPDDAGSAADSQRMARLLEALEMASEATPSLPFAWLRVRVARRLAHLALFEPPDARLVPLARTALLEGAARLTFTLTDAEALQAFSPLPLATPRLRSAGGAWWTWTSQAFLEAEGWRGARLDARPGTASEWAR